jgi:hypothetical protein
LKEEYGTVMKERGVEREIKEVKDIKEKKMRARMKK